MSTGVELPVISRGTEPPEPATPTVSRERYDELTRKVNIKISGCPNGCGQHHVGNIGFTGASR